MHDAETVRNAFELAEAGLTQAEIGDRLGIGHSTVGRWLRRGLDETLGSSRRARGTDDCPDRCPVVAAAQPEAYAYLLGQYLGDGTIVHTRRGVYRIFVSCCATDPDLVDECTRAIEWVLPDNRAAHRSKPGAIDVNCYSKHLPCLFPQHGPGRKHKRRIELAPWQGEIALERHPDLFVRGLIHSDGCRSINRVRNTTGREYAYVRYQFPNKSDDIKGLFTDACDRLGVEWRVMNSLSISVARRASVEKLERIVGPKT